MHIYVDAECVDACVELLVSDLYKCLHTSASPCILIWNDLPFAGALWIYYVLYYLLYVPQIREWYAVALLSKCVREGCVCKLNMKYRCGQGKASSCNDGMSRSEQMCN
jgi:hypothetical protein